METTLPEPHPKKLKIEHVPVEEPAASNDDDDDVQPSVTDDLESPADSSNTLSKRQRKKLIKLAQWEVKKKEKRLKEREKYREKRKSALASGDPTRTGPSRKALKHNRIDDSPNPITVAVDLEFDDLMIDKDVCKCAKQLLWVYTINRKAEMPLHLYYTGLKDGGRLQQALDKNDGYRNWDVHIKTESYTTLFESERIVYLTSDSDTVLTTLEKDTVYIVGGLVDHNHHKGLTLERATKKGLRTARLPLGEHVKIKARTVLTIVHGECSNTYCLLSDSL